MDFSQFPERLRGRVLSTVVRNMRAGIAIRFGTLRAGVLPLTVQQVDTSQLPELPKDVLEDRARAEFSSLPYELKFTPNPNKLLEL